MNSFGHKRFGFLVSVLLAAQGLSSAFTFTAVSAYASSRDEKYWDDQFTELKLRILGIQDIPERPACERHLMVRSSDRHKPGAQYAGPEYGYMQMEWQKLNYDGKNVGKPFHKPPGPSLEDLLKMKVLSLAEGGSGMVPYFNERGGNATGLDIDYQYETGSGAWTSFRRVDLTRFPALKVGSAVKAASLKSLDGPYDFIFGFCLHCQLNPSESVQSFSQAGKLLKPGHEALFTTCSNAEPRKTSFRSKEYLKSLKALESEGLSVEIFRIKLLYAEFPGDERFWTVVRLTKNSK